MVAQRIPYDLAPGSNEQVVVVGPGPHLHHPGDLRPAAVVPAPVRAAAPVRRGDRGGGHGAGQLQQRPEAGHHGRRAHRRPERAAGDQRAHRGRAGLRPGPGHVPADRGVRLRRRHLRRHHPAGRGRDLRGAGLGRRQLPGRRRHRRGGHEPDGRAVRAAARLRPAERPGDPGPVDHGRRADQAAPVAPARGQGRAEGGHRPRRGAAGVQLPPDPAGVRGGHRPAGGPHHRRLRRGADGGQADPVADRRGDHGGRVDPHPLRAPGGGARSSPARRAPTSTPTRWWPGARPCRPPAWRATAASWPTGRCCWT